MGNKFDITKLVSDKTIHIVLNGKFEKEDGLKYIEEYNSLIKTINPSEYTLRFDCTNLAVSANESLDILGDCFKMYSEANFKKVVAIVEQKQSVLSMQFNRLARNAGLDNFEVQK